MATKTPNTPAAARGSWPMAQFLWDASGIDTTNPAGTGRKSGFTLIELMVVLAITGILAAIIFPVFASVRARARQTACLSNLRQLALAVQMYAHDNNDYIPPYNSWFGGTSAVKPFRPMPDHGADLVACLAPYIHDRNVWFCPEDIYARTSSTQGSANHRYLSYGTSAAWIHDRGGRWVLGRTTLDFTTPRTEAGPTHGFPLLGDNLWPYWGVRAMPPPYSHRGRFNVVMFDGHVMSFPWANGRNYAASP